MGKKSTEILVGLFVLLGFAGLVFLALKAANLGSFASFGGSDNYELFAKFDNIGGLKVKAPVRSAGVTVGRVASITLDAKTYQGLVRLDMQHQVQFPSDTSARILTSGLLGDQYIGLEPGAREKFFAPGDTITQTQSAIVLESLISQFLFNKAADSGTSPAPAPTPAPTPAAGGKKQ